MLWPVSMLRVLVYQHEVDVNSQEVTVHFDQQILPSLFFELDVLVKNDLEFVILISCCLGRCFEDSWALSLDEEILDVDIILNSVIGECRGTRLCWIQ